ncbi:peptidyl-prolyl cis-trans isomerase [Flavobacteriaceae bacterium XHP0103]|uniref:peptidyl-prolyl cis-trans isomerase n=1 Tax=Marixanthotalea marina TaxID=2844359 RepID=UPI002989B8DD|nr:peptidyl-prolyl cis-trans isomerase [Marixanthotalea marina]MBU3821383.1 peptidyl-prolyl cis-trans isomerase [Marixanthotalea marina]
MRLKIIIVFVLLSSCDFFKKVDDRVPVARVNENYLYYDDIKNLVSAGTSKEDSTLVVQNFINRWATQQLLVDGAMLNLNEQKQAAFDKLVVQYKNDLYTKAYMDLLVKRSIDTNVTRQEAEKYYELNKDVFKLNEELLKFRYIHVDENIFNFDDIEKKFKRFNDEDKRELDSLSIQFKSYSLKDSIWVKASQVIDKIPVITPENKDELLKKSNFIQLKDSLGVYLMQINDVLSRNDTAPLEYVKPTIDQIVINKRKLEIIKELEKDITKDAIKNKQFEIYN